MASLAPTNDDADDAATDVSYDAADAWYDAADGWAADAWQCASVPIEPRLSWHAPKRVGERFFFRVCPTVGENKN